MTNVITTVSRRASAREVMSDGGEWRKRLNRTANSSPPSSISTATKCRASVTICSSFKSHIGAGKGIGSTAGKDCIRSEQDRQQESAQQHLHGDEVQSKRDDMQQFQKPYRRRQGNWINSGKGLHQIGTGPPTGVRPAASPRRRSAEQA